MDSQRKSRLATKVLELWGQTEYRYVYGNGDTVVVPEVGSQGNTKAGWFLYVQDRARPFRRGRKRRRGSVDR